MGRYRIPLVMSLIVEAIALVLAVVSAGSGHGTYGAAMLFFPLEMLLLGAWGLGILACIHYPLLVLGVMALPSRRQRLIGCLSYSALHLVCMAVIHWM